MFKKTFDKSNTGRVIYKAGAMACSAALLFSTVAPIVAQEVHNGQQSMEKALGMAELGQNPGDLDQLIEMVNEGKSLPDGDLVNIIKRKGLPGRYKVALGLVETGNRPVSKRIDYANLDNKSSVLSVKEYANTVGFRMVNSSEINNYQVRFMWDETGYTSPQVDKSLGGLDSITETGPIDRSLGIPGYLVLGEDIYLPDRNAFAGKINIDGYSTHGLVAGYVRQA